MSARTRTGVVALVVGIFCMVASGPAVAQEEANPLDLAIDLFHEGEWEQAVESLTRIVEAEERETAGHPESELSRLSRVDVSKARKYIGLGYILLGREEDAVGTFKEIVRTDPQFDMNALALGDESPPTEAVRCFGQAILEVRQEEIQAREARLRGTSRSGALFRSAVLPGWGQRYQGYKGRGYIITGTAAASVLYAILANRSYGSARDDYDSAGAGADFNRLYDAYSREADRAKLAWGVVGAVWLVNVVDAVFQEPNIRASASALGLEGGAIPGGLQVRLRKPF